MRTINRVAKRAALGATVVLAGMPGVASAACPTESTSQPFNHLGDQNHYFLAPGGDFEGATSWTRYGNATVVETGSNGVGPGASAARLPHTSSVTSPVICVDGDRPHLRFVARAGSDDGTLRVDAIGEDGSKTPLAKLDADDHEGWRVTRPVLLAAPLGIADAAPLKLVRLRLTAIGGSWLADDVYVDPYTRG